MANQQLSFEVVGKSNASEVMGKAGREADKLANKFKQAFDIKDALMGAFIGAFGAAALLNKAVQTITESFKDMGDIADKSAKAGISGAEFDQLSYAAGLAGVSTSVLSKSIRELRFMMKDAQKDTAKMTNLTKGLGFTEEEVRGGKIKTIEVFNRVSIALAQAQTDTEKLTILTKFFGDKVANDMLPVLEQIAKHPDMFKGLLVGSDEAYAKLDAIDEKFQKMYHNAKRLIGLGIFSAIQKNEEEVMRPSRLRQFLGGMFPTLDVLSKGAAIFTSAGDGVSNQANNATQAQKDGAKFLAKEIKKPDANTMAGSQAQAGGGVIGVGNNAANLIMEEQLDTLKEIKESIDRLGTPGYMNTDFTKPKYPTA